MRKVSQVVRRTPRASPEPFSSFSLRHQGVFTPWGSTTPPRTTGSPTVGHQKGKKRKRRKEKSDKEEKYQEENGMWDSFTKWSLSPMRDKKMRPPNSKQV